MPLNIYTSNRMERLIEALAKVLKEPPQGSPLTPEVIVLQSKGMQRWVAMELAKNFGIWANCQYKFPNAMVMWFYEFVLKKNDGSFHFSPEIMTFKIMRLLPKLMEMEEFTPLKNYLNDDLDGLRIFQISRQIADTFDKYTMFRPEMVMEWEAGKESHWQAELWRNLTEEGNGEHRGLLKQEFCDRLIKGELCVRGLPERIAVFGISYLPVYHMEILAAASRITEINFFLMTPTREYWADILSEKEKARLGSKDTSLYIVGNPLLASLGKLGRDFSDMVIEFGEIATVIDDIYDDPGESSLLQKLQSDILNLAWEQGGDEGERLLIDNDDLSVQMHSCHSHMREIEILYDNILYLLEKIEGLSPMDILVMTPEIESYAPFISAVFESYENPSLKIPFSIADRRLAQEGHIASVFMKLIELPGSRLSAIQIFDILNTVPVRRRFDLDDKEIGIIRGWIENTRVKWGMDEKDRSALGFSAYRENSWGACLERLFLGYAMPEEEGRVFNGILPYDDMEGSITRTLGKFACFMEKIAAVSENLSDPRTLSDWQEGFRAILSDFIHSDDDTAREFIAVSNVIENFGEIADKADFNGKVSLAVIRSWISSCIEKEENGFGFITGGVTFCAMLPMRSIPFRVIALIGMNDGEFPRQARPPGFDLIAKKPRRGDRSLRDEDRYLFLESILSARDCLCISYIGQSIKDNSAIPPSVLVSELLDTIDRRFKAANNSGIEDRLVTKHCLQAFSRKYFTEGSNMFSFSDQNCSAIIESLNSYEKFSFMPSAIAEPSDVWKDLSLVNLLLFFDNPAKFFLNKRLGIRLEDTVAPLEEREPFVFEGLELYKLKTELLDIVLQDGDPKECFHAVRCRGILPPARHGELLFESAVNELKEFSKKIREKLSGVLMDPLDFELDVDGGFRLSGRLESIRTDGMIRYRPAKFKARDKIRAWIEHLVLNLVKPEAYPGKTVLVMKDKDVTFSRVENPLPLLKKLIDFYWKGLSEPVRFFPETSMAYALNMESGADKAKKVWEEGYFSSGEGSDPYFHLCFGKDDPLNSDFEIIAQTIIGPMLQYQEAGIRGHKSYL